MLYCKKMDSNAKLPTVAHPDEDLGFDIYSIETVILEKNKVAKIRTGIAARYVESPFDKNFGLIIKDRSSLAAKNITVSGGVVDAGYAAEILVLLTNHNDEPYTINNGDKIAQLIPIEVKTKDGVYEVWMEHLPESERGIKGFGSTGK